MKIEFANVWILYLVWLIPTLGAGWYAANRRRQLGLAAFMSPAMQVKLGPRVSAARFHWQSGLILAGLLGCLIAAARPQWGTKEETVYERGRDLVIALDVSRSMLAADVRPNRLLRAKTDILDLIKELRGDRAALVAFRRTGMLLCPLTTDYAYLREALEAAGVDSAPPGETDIGDGIAKSLDAFESEVGSHKAIILISDGEDLTGRAVEVAEQAKKRNIPIFTVGLGSGSGSPIPEEGHPGSDVKYQGKDVITRLNNDTLYAIAKTTGGAYIPVATASMTSTTLGTLYRDHLRNIAAQELQETLQRRKVERFQWFLLPAVLLLLAGACLSRGRLKVGGRREEARGQRPEGRGQRPETSLPAEALATAAGQRSGGAMDQVSDGSEPGKRGGTSEMRRYSRRVSPRRAILRFLREAVSSAQIARWIETSNIQHSTFNVECGPRRTSTLDVRCSMLDVCRRFLRPEAEGHTAEAGGSAALKQLALAAVLGALAVGAGAQTTNGTPALAPPTPATNAPARTSAVHVPPGRPGARQAQRLYVMGRYAAAAEAYLQAAKGATADAQRDFRFNAAVALYREGKYRDAADLLQELVQTGPEADATTAVGLGSALFKAAEGTNGQDAATLAQKALLIREAGEAFKTALRTRPRDDLARRDLAVAANLLPEADEQAKIAHLTAQYQQTSPSQLGREMLQNQRALDTEIPSAFTNSAPGRIGELEALAARQSSTADLWIPLKGKLMQAMAAQPANPTNQQIMASLNQVIEATRDNMLSASAKLKDLDPAALRSAAVSEGGIYSMWRVIADYPDLLQEDLWRQTNTAAACRQLTATDAPLLQEASQSQKEASDLTHAFVQRFSAAVPEGGTAPAATNAAPPAASGTNAPAAQQGITAETRKKILDLAAQASAAQTSAASHLDARDPAAARLEQKTSEDLLREIDKLLPKNQSQSSKSQKSKDQQQQQKNEKQNQAQDQKSQSQPQAPQPQPEQKKQEAKEQEPKEKPLPEDVQKTLEKALQREKDHDEEVRERMMSIPSSPIDRDW